MKNGRNTECTQEITDKIAEDLRRGDFVMTVCKRYHISTPTYYSWKNRGAKGEQPFLNFLNTIEEAEAYYISTATAKWRDAADDVLEETVEGLRLIKKGDWRAIEAYLKKLHPKTFSENQHRVHLEQNEMTYTKDIDQLKDMAKQVMAKIASGDMPIDPGSQLIKCIDDRIRLLSGTDYEQRMADIEKKIGIG